MLMRHPNCPVFFAREGLRLGIQFPMSAAGAEHPCCKPSVHPDPLLLTHCVHQGSSEEHRSADYRNKDFLQRDSFTITRTPDAWLYKPANRWIL